MQPAEQYCFCMTRRFVALIAAIITLIKITAQVSFQTYIHNSIELKVTADYANYSVFIVGQVLQVLVTFLLLVAIYKENADMMWPYLCWLSLNLLLEGFGCLILVYTNPEITKIMRDFIVYIISLSLSVALIHFTNTYEKELRRREGKQKEDAEAETLGEADNAENVEA
ncbi:UNVERIFIED_CONTAM: hypothetical protein RMT77_006238 [Armadillidium vulgare]